MRKLSLEEVRQSELEILTYIDAVCKDNDLRYFLAFGSLLGAVRHKGFIPWDDDIDIFLPRDDFSKLLEILKARRGHGKFDCLCPLDEGYYYEYAKVIDDSTAVREKNLIETRCGVWVDVFPLDGLDKEDRITNLLSHLFERCRSISVHSSFPNRAKGIKSVFEFVAWKVCRIIGYQFFLKHGISISQKYKYDDCEYVGFAAEYPTSIKYQRKDWYENSVNLEFENHIFRAPAGYKDVLEYLYGQDYMQLPPVEKRVTHNITAYYAD